MNTIILKHKTKPTLRLEVSDDIIHGVFGMYIWCKQEIQGFDAFPSGVLFNFDTVVESYEFPKYAKVVAYLQTDKEIASKIKTY